LTYWEMDQSDTPALLFEDSSMEVADEEVPYPMFMTPGAGSMDPFQVLALDQSRHGPQSQLLIHHCK